jgi:hypothetical protein
MTVIEADWTETEAARRSTAFEPYRKSAADNGYRKFDGDAKSGHVLGISTELTSPKRGEVKMAFAASFLENPKFKGELASWKFFPLKDRTGSLFL